MGRIDSLSRQYSELADRYRETKDRETARRLREIRNEIRALVAAEYDEPTPRAIDGDERKRRRGAERDRRARKRAETLVAEWERWRYRRSKLSPDDRGVMLRPGERECRNCGTAFVPDTLRQRHCKTFKSGNPNYCRQMASR